MMQPDRREILEGLLGLSALGLLPACSAPEVKPEQSFLGRLPKDRRRALVAAVDRILPGSVAAGAMVFIDYWLGRPPFLFAKHEFDIGGLLLNRRARERYQRIFAECESSSQDAILGEFQQGKIRGKTFDGAGFFKRLFSLTIESFLGDPRYGGNQGRVGWDLIGWNPCWYSPKLYAVRPGSGGLPY